jgi:hypothetical protein
MTGDEDDRHVGAVGQLPLQLEPIQARQRHIEYETGWNRSARAGLKVLRGCEGVGVPARGSNQQLQRFAHGHVIVNNEDSRGDVRQLKDPIK